MRTRKWRIVFLLLYIVVSHGSGSSSTDLGDMAQQLTMHGGHDPNPTFEKIYEDVFCKDRPPQFDPPIFTGKMDNVKDCKAKCVSEMKCLYMAFWVKTKKCQLYNSCYSQKSDAGQRILVLRRVTPCEQEVENYVEKMRHEFPVATLRPMFMPNEWEKSIVPKSSWPNPNFFCKCIGISWMMCGIFLLDASWEFQGLMSRWTFNDLPNMKPFFVLSNGNNRFGAEKYYLAYADTPPRALAELQIIEHIIDEESGIRPGCLHISQCIRGSKTGNEPIQKRPFQSGEPVYVLETDKFAAGTNLPVVCIAVQAMRSYLIDIVDQLKDDGSFLDPLGRSNGPKEKLTIKEDYHILFIFDDMAMDTGICNSDGISDPTDFQGEQAEEGDETEDLSSQMEQMKLEQSQIDEEAAGPSRAVPKKKRRAGKKKKTSSSSQAGPSSQAGASSAESPSTEGGFQSLPSSLAGSPLVQLTPGSPSAGSPKPESLPSSLLSAGSPEPKPKVVLSKSDVDKLKRSFQEAKSRREKGSGSGEKEEHVSQTSKSETIESGKAFFSFTRFPYILFVFGFLLLAIAHRILWKTSSGDIYIEFKNEP